METLPGGRVFFAFDDKQEYTRDAMEEVYTPDVLFYAESESDIITAVQLCREINLPLIARGAGTGYTGGALAVSGGLLLSGERMKKLVIDPQAKTATVGPGVITSDLMAAAEEHNLFYPPDPASYKESTIGGNVAECAGGLRCKKYGVTKDYLVALRAVDASGRIFSTNQISPYGLSDILIGSEGTLCLFSEFTLRLIDRPQPGRTVQVGFNDPVDAASTVAEIIRRGIVPAIMEYMDGDAIACANAYEPEHAVDGCAAMLLMETDGAGAASEADEIIYIARSHSPAILREETDPGERENLWSTRRNISKAVKQMARKKISEDVCVLPSRLPELVACVKELADSLSIRINCFGHAGDGNLHVNFLSESGSPKEAAEIDSAVDRLFRKTLELQGTLTGEHGIGISKKSYLELEFDQPTLSFMRRLKRCFDPYQALNPGKIFAEG
jgi:glycolate oxidase